MKSGSVALSRTPRLRPKLTDLVQRIAPTPLFLIWAPNSGGENMNPDYFRLAGEPKSIWAIPEASHIQGITARPKEYERRVIAFFDDALVGADETR